MKLLHCFLFFLISYNIYAQNVKYKYDAANRLVEVQYSNQMSVKYYFDKDGNRIREATFRTGSQIGLNESDSLSLVKNGLTVYPNPATSNFNADFNVPSEQNITIRVTDINGKEIFIDTKKYASGNYTFELDIRPIPSGTYLLSVIGTNFIKSEKVIIGK